MNGASIRSRNNRCSRKPGFASCIALGLWLIASLADPTASRAAVTLTTGDSLGNSSFNSAGNWSEALAPHSGTGYVVSVIQLRTPASGSSFTFLGDSLTVASGGQFTFKGTGTAGIITVTNLILNGGSITHLDAAGDLFQLAGNLNITADSMIYAKQGPIVITAVISGNGRFTNPGADGTSSILTISNSVNTYTGSIVNNGRFTLFANANLNFIIGASNVNNRVSGTGAATTFNGRFVFDLSGASTNVGDSWTIASASGQTFGATFSVDGFSRQGFGTGPGTWDLSANGVVYEFVTSTGVMTVLAQASAAVSTTTLGVRGGKFGSVDADLAACYAPSYASSVGGEDNAQVLIANTVVGSNQIQDQGGTGAHMRIAGFYQSSNDLINATTTGGIVGWLSGNNANVQDIVAFGSLVGADLLVYICQDSDSATIAGVSQQPGMYSALNPGAVFYPVLAHETGGHSYGRSHSDGILNPKTIMLHNYCGGGAAPPYFYTNPNIWFNGVELIGDPNNNCSMGALINGGDNSSPSAEAVADRRPRAVVGPNLNNAVLHWSFTNAPGFAPAGTTIPDQISAAPAVVRGTNAVFTGSALRIPGGTSGNTAANSIAAYIDLPNGVLSSQTNITIEIWATPLSGPTDARIFDFGRTVQAGDGLGAAGEYTGAPGTPAPGVTQASDDILLTAAITDLNEQRFQAQLNGGTAITLDAGLATTAGVQHHYAITFTDGAGSFGGAGGRWQWYRDGDAVAFLDVNFHLADIEDVNNWLGRPQSSGDLMANTEYAEVRISSVALSRNEVLANYLLGPNYVPTATVTLTNADATGATSFNAAGQWSNGAAPSSGNSYETLNFQLLTPSSGSPFTFLGDSLKISGGALLFGGTSGSTITITNLILNGGAVRNSGSGICTLAGNILVTTNGAEFNGVNGGDIIAANLSGNGPITYLGNATTLSGNNSGFTGKTFIGNGAAGTVVIDSQARLGPNPAVFTPDQLSFDRGTLQVTTSMALSDSNRGIFLDVSGGTFNVPSGVTLTLSNTMSTPVTVANIVVGSITKANAGTLVLSSPTNSFKGTLFVDTSSNSGNDGVVKLVNNQVLASAHSPIVIRNNNGGTSTFQLDGTAGNLTLSQGIMVNCRNNTSPAIENLVGTNTINGFVTLSSGGSLFNIQSDAGLLILAGTNQYLGPLVGGRTYTFQGTGDHLVSGPILNSTNGSAVSLSKSGTGRLTLTATNTYASTTTINSGTLAVSGNGLIANSATITVAGAATLDLSGHTGGGMTFVAGQTLTGGGTVTGAVTIANSATLSPGVGGPGTLTVKGNLVLNNSSTLAFDLGTSSDQTVVNGNLTLDGVLTVTDAGGFGVGNYTLITYTGTLTDNGLVVNNPLPGGLNGTIVAGGGTVVLQVASGDPFTRWQNQYFGGTNCALCGGDADFDGDGLSNTNEFLAGFNPTNTAAYPHIIAIAVSNGTDIAITYLGSNGDTNYPGGPMTRTNIVEFAAGTTDGGYTSSFASTGLTNILSGGVGLGTNVTVTESFGATNSPARYYRVRVLVP